jgi:hypothetical protein
MTDQIDEDQRMARALVDLLLSAAGDCVVTENGPWTAIVID